LPSSVTGNANAAAVAALAASTSGLAGMALKVDRIIPVEYSAVTVRTASVPSTTAAIMTPLIEALTGSNNWRCWAVMVCHWLICDKATATLKPMPRTRARVAVRQVEGRVRSFVHSALRMRALRVRLTEAARTGRAGVRMPMVALMSGSLAGAGQPAGVVVGFVPGQLEEGLLERCAVHG
jgi:hypothetical protein